MQELQNKYSFPFQRSESTFDALTLRPQLANTGGTFSTDTCAKMLHIPVLIISRNSITLIRF